MWDSVFTSLWLQVVLQLTCTQQIDVCPDGWFENGGQCYNFVSHAELTYQGATIYCQHYEASLASIKTSAEHSFIKTWLSSHDARKQQWFTSGYKDITGKLVWDADGSDVTNDYFPDTSLRNLNYVDPISKIEYNIIVYKFNATVGDYVWSWGHLMKAGPFVCQIAKLDTWKLFQRERDFSYGTNVTDPTMWETGPNITGQSGDTVFFEFGGHMMTVVLDCLATGNPSVSYKWLLRTDNAVRDQVVDPAANPRISLNNGRLTITNPDQVQDTGTYTCEASNKLGNVLSNPIHVSYGYIGQFPNVKPSQVDAVMYMGIEITCQVPVHNTDLRYNWFKSNNNFIRSEFNPQFFLSRNGKLYISEVQDADQDEYFCVIFMAPQAGQELTGTQPPSRTSLGIDLRVRGENANTYGPEIQNKFPQYFPTVPMAGDDVEIECLAYGRLPLYYSWVREDGPLHPRAYLRDHNRVLVLPSARLEDTGTYTCVVRNERNYANKTVFLQLNALPHFPYPLHSQHVDEGRSFQWTCNAIGFPKPVYQWYKNGKILATNAGIGIKVNRNILTIDKVEASKHNGMYQCEATNTYGLARSSAQLRALSLAPTFLSSPVETTKQAAEGGNVTIVCRPQAAPRADITWLKNGVQVGRVLPSGALELTSLSQSDSGTYTCVATNDLGEARSSCLLTVQGKTVFAERPTDLEVEQNSTAVLPCKASYDRNKMEVTYSWLLYSHAIDFSLSGFERAHYSMPFAYNLESGMLYIMAAQFRHAGMYTCVVSTVSGSISASAYVTVRGPPDEPMGVHVKQANDLEPQNYKNVALWWQDGAVNGYPVNKYTIEYLSIYEDGWNLLQADVPVQDTVMELYPAWRKFDITTGLSPGTAYQFRVKAGNDQIGYGPPSNGPYKWYNMMSAPPIFSPPNIGGGGGSVGQLIITWNPLPKSQWGGPNLRYVVYFRLKQEENSNRKWEMSGELKDTFFHTVVGTQYYYTEYEVKVQAVNDRGSGPNSTIVIVYSAEDMPSNVSPTYSGYEVLNGTAAIVHWIPVPNTREAARGTVFAYQVNYWEEPTTLCLGTNEHHALFNRYYGNSSSGLLIGMEPEGHYCFNFQFINHAGMGPKTDNYNFNLNLRAPGLYPEYVTVMSHGNDSVRIEWRGVSVHVGEEHIVGYKAWWWDTREDIRSAKIEVFDKTGTGVLLGIQPDVIYKVRVLGYSIGGDGRKSPSVYFTLGGQLPFDPATTEVLNTSPNHKGTSLLFSFCLLLLNLCHNFCLADLLPS